MTTVSGLPVIALLLTFVHIRECRGQSTNAGTLLACVPARDLEDPLIGCRQDLGRLRFHGPSSTPLTRRGERKLYAEAACRFNDVNHRRQDWLHLIGASRIGSPA